MNWETDARFRCPECTKEVAANVLLPEPPPKDDQIRFSGGESVIITCPECETSFTARAFVTPSMCSLTFIDHPEEAISASPPMVRDVDDELDAWLYDTPADPYSIFNASMAEARFLLDQHGGDGASLLNRMVFTHYISATEAFLADTIINEVLGDGEALQSLIQRDLELKERKFSLAEISASPNLIKDTVRSRLRDELWHRIGRASALYKISLGVDIRAMLGEDNEIVEQAIQLRHDCVHRNGQDKDGNALTAFTKDYVIGLGGILSRLAHNVVKALKERRAQKFFGSEPM